MTYKEVAGMIAQIGLPFDYYQLKNGTGKKTPFVVYYFSGIDDLYADNLNYQRIVQLTIELYTNTKRIDLENKVEEVLAAAGLTYTKNETYIDTEQMYEQIYQTEVLINE